MMGINMNEKAGKWFLTCMLAGMMSVALMTGCKNEGEETSTVAQVEISTAMEETENSKLDGINLEAYKKLAEEEKEEVLDLYLTELYKLEETELPEGEEYEEVFLALKPAVESVLKNNPDKTLQDLLEEANNLQNDPEGISIEEFFAQEMNKDLDK